MKISYVKLLSVYLFLILISTACLDSASGPNPDELTGESISYELSDAESSGVSGTLQIAERVDGFSRVTLELSELPDGDEFPVVVYTNTALQEGEELIILMSAGESGISITNVYSDVDGNTVRYEHWEELDAHILVHDDSEEESVIAQADIGVNALTGEEWSWELETSNDSGIDGAVTLYERNSGFMKALIQLEGADPDETYIARLYASADEDEEHIFTFSEISGETGGSASDMYEQVDGSEITFSDFEEFTGVINIYTDDSLMNKVASVAIMPEE
jgi:hypothetical protein